MVGWGTLEVQNIIHYFRCDGKVDCKDSSDELKCRVVDFDSSYNKFLSPPLPQSSVTQKLGILSSITIHSLASFDPVNQSYDVQFTVLLKWFDARLSFNNLRSTPEINGLQPAEVEQIWFPYFQFENTNKKEFSLLDNRASLKVLKMGAGILNGNQDTENKYVFDGNDNHIVYKRFYSEVFECEYSLHWYPFDTQICYLDIKPSPDLRDLIQFATDKFEYEGPLDLTEYTVKKISMGIEKDIMLRVEIVIQRRLLSLILTAFLPTVILNIIGHMSNYFKEFFFEGLMSLNVTVMLVLTTMFLRHPILIITYFHVD